MTSFLLLKCLPVSSSYPQTFIEKQLRIVFENSILTTAIHPTLDESRFLLHRTKLMGTMTARQSQVDHRITLSKLDNGMEPMIFNTNLRKQKKLQDRILLHYTHENRLQTMKRDIHEVFRQSFIGLGIDNLRLIVGHRNSPSIQRELIRKRPPINLLKKFTKSNPIEHRQRSSFTVPLFQKPNDNNPSITTNRHPEIELIPLHI